MKNILVILALFTAFISLQANADPVAFGLALNKTTESEFLDMYSSRNSGVNKYSQGNMYDVSRSEVEFADLQSLQVIFDDKEILQAVIAVFPKHKFEYLNKNISKKYKLISKNIPFVGDTDARYRSGKTDIILDAPHMSFKMTLTYATRSFLDKVKKINRNEKTQQQNQESSLL